MIRRFTGWHITAILASFFGIVFAVNFYMAYRAVHGFGGVVVENSYVASQNFNKWLAEARAEDAYGWQARLGRDGDGRLEVIAAGAPRNLQVQAELRHPLGRGEVQRFALERRADGRFVSGERLPEGRWLVRVTLSSNGRHQRIERPLG